MKRTLLALLTAVTLLAPLAPAADAALPSSAVVKDARGDVDKFKGSMGVAKIRHPYDVHKVRGAITDTDLVVTISLENLTRKNTEVYQRPNGWWTYKGNFQAEVYVNGTYRYVLNRDFSTEYAEFQKIVRGPYGPETGDDITCTTTPVDLDDSGVPITIDTVTDKVTFRVPLACIGARPGDVFRIATQVNTGDRDPNSYYDASEKTPKFSF